MKNQKNRGVASSLRVPQFCQKKKLPNMLNYRMEVSKSIDEIWSELNKKDLTEEDIKKYFRAYFSKDLKYKIDTILKNIVRLPPGHLKSKQVKSFEDVLTIPTSTFYREMFRDCYIIVNKNTNQFLFNHFKFAPMSESNRRKGFEKLKNIYINNLLEDGKLLVVTRGKIKVLYNGYINIGISRSHAVASTNYKISLYNRKTPDFGIKNIHCEELDKYFKRTKQTDKGLMPYVIFDFEKKFKKQSENLQNNFFWV